MGHNSFSSAAVDAGSGEVVEGLGWGGVVSSGAVVEVGAMDEVTAVAVILDGMRKRASARINETLMFFMDA